MAWALAGVFGSLPVAGRLILGTWGFVEAAEVAGVLAVVGTYLHIAGRRALRALPDAASMMDEALQLAREGRMRPAMALLTDAIRLSPRVWQAWQYRGELYLAQGRGVEALRDFDEAIGLAAHEPHLYLLREQARNLLEIGEAGEAAED
jgi:tetratricopeptide (TPR) repeat protein